MKILKWISSWTVAVSLATAVTPQALAQDGGPDKITEQEKRVFQDMVNAQKAKARQTLAVMNARQIGLALFEFEVEYGTYPNEKTAAEVKKATKTAVEVKAATANDCFFQLIPAGIVQTTDIFYIDDAVAPEKRGNPKPIAMEKLDKCSFAYLSGMNSAGPPGRPLSVAPLVNGKATFDPQVLGGKAIILFCDNSVRSFPIEPDGRVLINGKDIFDPAQPFWDGKVPPIKWPAK
jgi:hypothetical protein